MAKRWNVAIYGRDGMHVYQTDDADEHTARDAYREICRHVLGIGCSAVLYRVGDMTADVEERYERVS